MMNGVRNSANGKWKPEDEVVISGISGRFPESDNVDEFKKNLFDGIDLITDDDRKWPADLFNVPNQTGKLKSLKHFDAGYFGVSGKLAEVMDPHIRILLELTHEAIIDAGVNPSEIRGSKTGVFIGASSSASEAEQFWSFNLNKLNGYEALGSYRSMLANRISYSYDFTGPSYTIDASCSSGLYALQQAVTAIKSGQCEAAIVGSVYLVLMPYASIVLTLLNMLNPAGMCKTFDENAAGYVRGEGAVVIYLQKSKVAKRIYATVVGAKTSVDGYKEQGITYPSRIGQSELLCELYEEIGVDPSEVAYVEAHGTGTKVGDPTEVNAIADVLCKNRTTPLLIGSVKSNMGHSEPASGLCSIVKTIIAMESGIIPQNLHFDKPNQNIQPLIDGRVKVVDRNLPWNGGCVGINCFGFGGTNAHVVLKSHEKPKINNLIAELPKVYFVSGRTSEAVNYFISKIEQTSNDNELLALIHEIHKQNIPRHSYRGYCLPGKPFVKETQLVQQTQRPIWFIYSGMGSQWPQMGRDMMKLDIFKKSIEKCAEILKQYNISLEEIILNSNDSTFQNLTNCTVGIVAIQIALTDTLMSFGIHPNGIIGHSLGEIMCAYADGVLSMEQVIMCTYVRGKSVTDSPVPIGSMASVGLSWEECKIKCPAGVYPACQNSQDNVTIAGPPDLIKTFVQQLKKENIFAVTVDSAGKAFHSKYIENAGPMHLAALERIIPNPKPRSSRWISTCFPQDEWETPTAKMCSRDYFQHNLLFPVLFHEAVQHIPENAIVIEIAPHCLMQAILKRTLKPNNSYIGLMKKSNNENNLSHFMSSLGKLYIAGANPNLTNIYQVSYPVGRGTPMLSPMIKWDHSTDWLVPTFVPNHSKSAEMVTKNKDGIQDLKGHIINRSNSKADNNSIDIIANVLGFKESKSLCSDTNLSDLGMDSIMEVEIMQILEKNFDIDMKIGEISSLTIGKLRELCSNNI